MPLSRADQKRVSLTACSIGREEVRIQHVDAGRIPAIRCRSQGVSGRSRSVAVEPSPVERATAHLVFRSRAVRVAGTIEFVVGLLVVLAGSGLAVRGGNRNTLPLGIAVCLVGLMMILSGLNRITARMEISKTHLTWIWSFSKQTLALEELDDAALVVKGAPASGSAWAGFLGGGFIGTLAWWLFDVCWGFVTSEPSLGSVELIVVKHYGGPVPIKPIGAWSTRPSHSEAALALDSLRTAIASSTRRQPVVSRILRTDAWEQSADQ